jgi:hypothetical protein
MVWWSLLAHPDRVSHSGGIVVSGSFSQQTNCPPWRIAPTAERRTRPTPSSAAASCLWTGSKPMAPCSTRFESRTGEPGGSPSVSDSRQATDWRTAGIPPTRGWIATGSPSPEAIRSTVDCPLIELCAEASGEGLDRNEVGGRLGLTEGLDRSTEGVERSNEGAGRLGATEGVG